MFTRRAFAGLVAAGVAGSAQAARAQQDGPAGHRPPPATGGSRRADVAALRAFAEATHPRGREAAADPKWRETWNALTAGADTLSDGAFFVGLWRGISWFRDGHTTVLPFEFMGGAPAPFANGAFARYLPLKARVFHDGIWVVEAKDEAGPLLGARIRSANGVSDIDLMKKLAEIWPGSEAWAHNWSGVLFNTAGPMQGLGILSDPAAPIRIEAVTADGRPLTVQLRARADGNQGRSALTPRPSELDAWRATHRVGNYVHPLPRSRSLYVSIDDMSDVEGKTFVALTRELFAAMEGPGVQRIIIDLRRNGGGDNFNGEPLRKALERSRFNRPGGIYVMTSPATFSAAQNLATRLERETYALFVGEPTGGAPNHYGDAAHFRGEASGIMAMVSTVPWFDSYPMDHRKWILPDLPVASTFTNWREGRDPALALCLSHKATGQINDLADDRAAVFGRASQKVKWMPFWRT